MRSQKSWPIILLFAATVYFLIAPTDENGNTRAHLGFEKETRSITVTIPTGRTDAVQDEIDAKAYQAAVESNSSTYTAWNYSEQRYEETPVEEKPEPNQPPNSEILGGGGDLIIGVGLLLGIMLLFMANRRLGIRME